MPGLDPGIHSVALPITAIVREWTAGIYDMEVGTSALSPAACAELIRKRLAISAETPSAFERLAAMA